ncbi:methyltransferase domain-containing protein [Deltaproteobacteria bacterium TL4]
MRKKNKIGFVILNFLTYEDSYELLESLVERSDINQFSVQIYMVDNQSCSEKYRAFQAKVSPLLSSVCFLSASKNLGFAQGLNLGIEQARKEGCEFVVCSNNDILIQSVNFFQTLVDTYLKDTQIAVIGPSIKNLNNQENQNPYIQKRALDHSARRWLYQLQYSTFFGKPLFYLVEYLKRLKAFLSPRNQYAFGCQSEYIYCVHGSFFILTPAYFQHFSTLDPHTFLYFEECIIAERVYQKGLKEYVNAELHVLHKDDSSTNTLFKHNAWRKLQFVLKHNFQSGKYFYKHYVASNSEAGGSAFNPSYIGKRDDIIALIPPQALTFLDVGCSTGVLGKQIKAKFPLAQVYGVELDDAMSKVASQVLDQVYQGSAERIDLSQSLKQESVDCIIFADVLEHLQDPWSVLSKYSAFLKPEGVIISSLPNVRHYSTLVSLIFKAEWPYRERGIHDRTHLRFFTKKNMRFLFENAGLSIETMVPNYRLLERPSKFNKLSFLLALPVLKDFITFQYLLVAKKSLSAAPKDLHSST